MQNFSTKQENLFWQTIKECHDEDEDIMVYNLINELANWEDEDIIAFEILLRDKIKLLNNWDAFAACVIREREPTDDDFLYYRLWIISQGKDFFYSFLSNPDNVSNVICQREIEQKSLDFTSVGFVDRAFFKKNGEDTDKKTPREFGFEYYDYDFNDDLLAGKPLKHNGKFSGFFEDAEIRLPKLAACYRFKRAH